MKILWLSHLVPYPPKGGVLQRSYNMVKEMGKYHEITLIAFNQSDFLNNSMPEVDNPLSIAKHELMKSVRALHILDIPENNIPMGRYFVALKALLSGSSYNMLWLKSSEAFKVIEQVLSKEKFDAIHLDTISLCVYFDLFENIPVVLNHHNFESHMLLARAEGEKNWLKSYYYKLEASRLMISEIKYCKESNLNLTCSDEDAQKMNMKLGDCNYLTVPNGVDIEYFYPDRSVAINDKSIVIVGGLSWYPNREAVEYFLREIWPLIKKQTPEMRVDIIGRNPSTEIVKLAEREERVFIHGFVDDVRPFLWQAQFYLCPIRIGGGTKLKILDALASGCCIIADPFSCVGINVSNRRDVVFSESPEEYVNNIKWLMNNPEQQEKLRRSGPRLIRERYSYDQIGKLYSESLVNLVKFKNV
ncbi:glycosyltransferase family 4 protein [Marinobacter sp.]|uniref:glycosyltransferase family 4 protein n=1 Tax=Marinobacter sp. TaxID=50741 RepID=UPI003A8EB1B9